MSMEDLLKAILAGAGGQMSSQAPQGRSQQDPLADILGAILGGTQPPGGAQQGAGDLQDILGGILGGGTQQPRGAQQGAGDLQDILEGILGGGAQQAGRAQQGTGGIGDILGGILGGGSSMSSNTFLGPIVENLAKQLGLPPAIAQMVVSFVLSKILGSAASRATTPSQITRPSQALPSQRPAQPQAQQGLDLDDLLEQMSAGQALDTGYLSRTGMTQELAAQTGMDTETAAMSLQQALQMLGGALGTPQQARQTSRSRPTSRSKTPSRKRSTPRRGASTDRGLDSLLDEFKPE